MIRTQIQLEEEQYKRLKEMSEEKGISMAHLIRESVDQVLQISETEKMDELRQFAISIAGKYHDIEGATDVAENHDKYLAEIYGTW